MTLDDLTDTLFVGQVMKETKGQADARAVNELVRAKLQG
jgi:Asp-tRNA(Asn)/Glu-tRNA(Gln) amidotransferase B subunit